MNRVPADCFYDSADGLRLYCGLYSARRSGGLPVLCFPGLTRNGRDFVALAARLSELHDVLTADLRGRGRSARDPDPSHYQLTTCVQDAFALLQSCGVNRVIVVGTSLGGLMAMVMPAMKPALIAAVVCGSALPGLSDAQWLEYARQGYREIEGVPVPDMDPKIAAAFANPATGPSDLWPVYAQVKSHAHVSSTRRTVGSLERTRHSLPPSRERFAAR